MNNLDNPIIIYSGFKNINVGEFSENVKFKRKKLVESNHVFNVKEIGSENICLISCNVIRQTSVTLEPYLVKLKVSYLLILVNRAEDL